MCRRRNESQRSALAIVALVMVAVAILFLAIVVWTDCAHVGMCPFDPQVK